MDIWNEDFRSIVAITYIKASNISIDESIRTEQTSELTSNTAMNRWEKDCRNMRPIVKSNRAETSCIQ